MDITNDGAASINFGEYFTKQFLLDLAKMAELRAELELRQGALSAVEQTTKLKSDAEAALAAAKVKADDLVATATKKNEASQVRADDLVNREAALVEKSQAFEADYATRSQALADAENIVTTKEIYLVKRDADMSARATALADTESALNARIKAFQEKVAAISA
jgi:hypothetical protein